MSVNPPNNTDCSTPMSTDAITQQLKLTRADILADIPGALRRYRYWLEALYRLRPRPAEGGFVKFEDAPHAERSQRHHRNVRVRKLTEVPSADAPRAS